MGMHTETIEHWVSEYLSSTHGEMQARGYGDKAGAVLVAFLEGSGADYPASRASRSGAGV